mmetsp:Transcript_63616/g.124916  ORF Transcript_63616/g.124916 Transcript_63616/m.124916 type:complete len:249 (+) Transcript_63616:467-1213(+)
MQTLATCRHLAAPTRAQLHVGAGTTSSLVLLLAQLFQRWLLLLSSKMYLILLGLATVFLALSLTVVMHRICPPQRRRQWFWSRWPCSPAELRLDPVSPTYLASPAAAYAISQAPSSWAPPDLPSALLRRDFDFVLGPYLSPLLLPPLPLLYLCCGCCPRFSSWSRCQGRSTFYRAPRACPHWRRAPEIFASVPTWRGPSKAWSLPTPSRASCCTCPALLHSSCPSWTCRDGAPEIRWPCSSLPHPPQL